MRLTRLRLSFRSLRAVHTVRAANATLLLASVLVCCGCAGGSLQPGESSPRADAPPIPLTLLHTNDIHGRFRDAPATRVDTTAVGGFAHLSAHVERERSRARNVLLLDAGDVMTGNPICEYEYKGVRGGALIEFMNEVGYDAMALGHHEFDLGPRNLDGLLDLARFPILSANTRRLDGRLSADEAFHIFDVGGLRVGVVGLMTEDLTGIVARSSLAGTKVAAAVDAARDVVRQIDAETDVIVLVTHVGLEADRVLARKVPGIDVIVGGHSHTSLEQPVVENGVVIAQAGSHAQVLGRLELVVANDRLVSHAGELIPLLPIEGGDPELRRSVAEYGRRIERDYGRVIGRLKAAWRRSRDRESNIGSWLCDQLREHAGTDFAVYNSGGIRKDVEAGPITRLDVFELLPFANLVATFECTGEELIRMMETNAKAALEGDHSILQVSGMRYGYARDRKGVRIIDPSVGGAPVDPKAIYSGATVDYVLYSNPARYFGFDPRQRSIEGSLISNVIVRAVEQSQEAIEARRDGRIRALGSR